MADDDDNTMYQLLLLEHLKKTKSLRLHVADGLKKLLAAEENLERKNLFQAAADLLELKTMVTVHFETTEINH